MLRTVAIVTVVLIFITVNSYTLTLMDLLQRDVVVSVKHDDTGKFKSAQGWIIINAPFEFVWDVIIDIEKYTQYMPNVIQSKIIFRSPDNRHIIAQFELEVPMVNTKYTVRYDLDKEKKIILSRPIRGDLRGSSWSWRLYRISKNKTIASYGGQTVNFSAFVEKLDDTQKNVALGINVSSFITAAKALKKRTEVLYIKNGKKKK